MSLISVEDGIKFIKGENANQGPKVNFRKINREVLESQKKGLKEDGITEKALKKKNDEFQDAFKGSSLKFGVNLDSLKGIDDFYSTKGGKTKEYIEKRLSIIDELISRLQSTKNNPNAKAKQQAFLELAKESKATIYTEEIQTALTLATKDDKEGRSFAKQSGSAFIADDKLVTSVLEVLESRKNHLSELSSEKVDPNRDIVWDTVKVGGVTLNSTTTLPWAYGKGKAILNPAGRKTDLEDAVRTTEDEVKDLDKKAKLETDALKKSKLEDKAYKRLQKLDRIETQLNNHKTKYGNAVNSNFKDRISGFFKNIPGKSKTGLSKIWNKLDDLVKFVPGPIGFALKGLVVATTIAGVIRAGSAVVNSDKNWLKAMGEAIHNQAVGNSASYVQAAASWVIPDLGLLAGGKEWSFFDKGGLLDFSGKTNEKITSLQEEVQEGVTA
jgi:hypothetical protein